jgi:hypothetical protein
MAILQFTSSRNRLSPCGKVFGSFHWTLDDILTYLRASSCVVSSECCNDITSENSFLTVYQFSSFCSSLALFGLIIQKYSSVILILHKKLLQKLHSKRWCCGFTVSGPKWGSCPLEKRLSVKVVRALFVSFLVSFLFSFFLSLIFSLEYISFLVFSFLVSYISSSVFSSIFPCFLISLFLFL